MNQSKTIVVPPALVPRLEAIVARLSAELSEPVEDCRKLVESHIVAGGIVRFERALDLVIAEQLQKESA